MIAILATAGILAAFDGTAGWKKKADGTLELDASGNPVWVDKDGKEGDPAAVINRLNGEAAGHRQRAEAAEAKVTKYETDFKDIDPAKARTALETVSKIDGNKLIDSGKLDEVRNEVNKAWEPKLTAAEQRAKDAEGELSGLRLTTAFQGSKFVTDKLTIPADLAMAQFGRNFAWENGKFVAKGSDGNPIYSGKNPGQHADFDEALETLVGGYANKAAILKGGGGQGSGNEGGGGNGGGGKKRVTMAEFTKLDPAGQAAHAADVRAGKAELVDG